MREFFDAIAPFVYGFVLGYFGHPVWTILKKIWAEARQARKDW